MSTLSLNKDTLQQLITYFTQQQQDFDNLGPQITQHLQQLADDWRSDGARRGQYDEVSSEYQKGVSQLTEATTAVLSFLNETLIRVEQTGL